MNLLCSSLWQRQQLFHPSYPPHLLSLSRVTEVLAGHISNLPYSHDNMTRFCSSDGNKSGFCNFWLVPQEKKELSPPLSFVFFLLSLFPEAGVWIWGEPSLTINLGMKNKDCKIRWKKKKALPPLTYPTSIGSSTLTDLRGKTYFV